MGKRPSEAPSQVLGAGLYAWDGQVVLVGADPEVRFNWLPREARQFAEVVRTMAPGFAAALERAASAARDCAGQTRGANFFDTAE